MINVENSMVLAERSYTGGRDVSDIEILIEAEHRAESRFPVAVIRLTQRPAQRRLPRWRAEVDLSGEGTEYDYPSTDYYETAAEAASAGEALRDRLILAHCKREVEREAEAGEWAPDDD